MEYVWCSKPWGKSFTTYIISFNLHMCSEFLFPFYKGNNGVIALSRSSNSWTAKLGFIFISWHVFNACATTMHGILLSSWPKRWQVDPRAKGQVSKGVIPKWAAQLHLFDIHPLPGRAVCKPCEGSFDVLLWPSEPTMVTCPLKVVMQVPYWQWCQESLTSEEIKKIEVCFPGDVNLCIRDGTSCNITSGLL